MKLELLISTMNQSDTSLVRKMNCVTDALIVNQCDRNDYTEDVINGHSIRMISTTQRGLSRSRNMALAHAQGDICLICDDDEVMEEGYETIVMEAFKRHPTADIIAFNYHDLSPRVKRKLIEKEAKSSRWRMFSSVSLAFKRERVMSNIIWFDPRLGAGSGCINAGEESSWQSEAIKKKLVRYECPDYIATVMQESSTWFHSYDESYFFDVGANLSIYHPLLKYLLMLYYPYRLRGEKSISFIQKIKWELIGMNFFQSNGGGYKDYIRIRENRLKK